MTNPDGRSALFPRSFRKSYPRVVRGEGVWLWDAEGKRYLDFSGSAAVNFVGHGDKGIGEAMLEQVRAVEFAHTSQFITPAAEQFAEEILEFLGVGFRGGAVFFTSGGSEAIETALKLARQYQVEIGQGQRVGVMSRQQAYHGATFGAMAVSGNRQRREIYLPMLPSCDQVRTPYCYRCAYGCDGCAAKYAGEVERALERGGRETLAFILEPVSGATLGAVAPPDGYLQQAVTACATHGVLVIADEVMTGFGRTGRNFAMHHGGIDPDIVTVGKGIASGYAALGAVVATRKVVDAIANGSGSFVHGFTYNAHPVAVAAGRAVLARIRGRSLVQAAFSDAGEEGSAGTWLKAGLQSLLTCGSVGDVRGLGLLWGVEFVTDKASKVPYKPEIKFAFRVAAAAARRGVMVYPMQGCVDGIAGDHLLITPPVVITREEIVWAIERLREAIEDAEKG